ncbi:GntR family transcriptional regulator [Pseudonocardia acidicola]|uniref:GntR family transcriptional regulator n=1 Tax=Pseudonocardia acidicola TaxID=2724939 RepID=A0ABX1S2F4_9PSEU|nr:GntR family transcriptional regulator [Pseudonocardia acidicola]NMH95736.1 GntR family transcriptional regulator [Pseudonocardia acidicola]
MSQPGNHVEAEFAEPPATSMASAAYLGLRDLLVTVQIPPGAPISEEQVMRRLGVGRTPVRESIKRLEIERLVAVYPRRGVFATAVHITDVGHLAEVRVQLEGEAAALAAQRATIAQREGLRALRRAAENLPTSPADLIAFDTRVHRAIYRSTGNPYLENTLSQYHNLMLRIWHLFLDRMPEIAGHVDEFAPVLDAIVQGDADLARRIATRHVDGFVAAVLSVV